MMILYVVTLLITAVQSSSHHVQLLSGLTSSAHIPTTSTTIGGSKRWCSPRNNHCSFFITSKISRGGDSGSDRKGMTETVSDTTAKGKQPQLHQEQTDSAVATEITTAAAAAAVPLSHETITLDHVREAPLLADIELLSQLLSNLVSSEDSTVHALYECFRIAGLERASNPNTTTSEPLRRMIEMASIDHMSADQAVGVMRTFSIMLNLVNSAEVTHRTRIMQQHELFIEQQQEKVDIAQSKAKSTMGPLPLFEDSMRGTMDALLSSTNPQPVSSQQIYDQLLRQKVEIVLTAHPTQVQRKSLLRKYRTISETLQLRNDDSHKKGYGPIEIRENLARIISSIWGADEIRRSKPTPQQEAAGGNAVIETVLWDAVPTYLRKLHTQCQIQLNKTLPIDCCPIKFASWIGGDRDGTFFSLKYSPVMFVNDHSHSHVHFLMAHLLRCR